MAHRILGIDLGHFSIKLASLEVGFRSLRLLSLHEKEVPAGPNGSITEGLRERQFHTLQTMLQELRLRPEHTATALESSGMFRILSLPFSDPKKIESVLPFELEGEFLTNIESQALDFLVVPDQNQNDQKLSGVKRPHQVLAAVANREIIDLLLERFGTLNLQPKMIGASALTLSALCAFPKLIPSHRPLGLLDLGHRYSNFCILNHATIPAFARTLDRGGYDVSHFLSQRLQIDFDQAQTLKHQSTLTDFEPLQEQEIKDASIAKTSELLKEALRPLVRDLRQTLAASMATYGQPLEQLILFGGGSRLNGIDRFLAHELGMAVTLWQPPQIEWMKAALVSSLEPEVLLRTSATALSLGLSLSRHESQINFRKRESSYRTHLQLLRAKVPAFIGSGLAIFLCGVMAITASFYSLNRATKILEQEVQKQTKILFGEETISSKEIETKLNQKVAQDQIPTLSALDLLESLSSHAPKQVVDGGQTINADLEVTDLDIKSQQIVIKATAASAQYVDDLEKAWAHLPCIKTVTKGKIQPLAEKNRKQFSMEILTCL